MRALRAYTLLFPAALLAAFGVTWLAGRFTLGHWPRPSLDDPSSLGLWVDIPYTMTGALLVLGLPVFIVAALALLWQAVVDAGQRRRWLTTSAVSMLAMTGVIALLRWDPWGVVDWFMD